MNSKIKQINKQIGRLITEDEAIDNGIANDKENTDIMHDKVFPWILNNVIPPLIIGLIIDITIMFSVPVETTMSSCFWLKDPISLCVGFLIVRGFYFLKNSFLPCKD